MNMGITARSPANKDGRGSRDMEDVELGSSSHGGAGKRHNLKAKNSDMEELQPLVIDNGDGSSKTMPTTPRGAITPRNAGGEAEQHSTTKSIIASAMYSTCSVGMVLVNKSLASR